jgi:CDP-diacylglycerol--glycerol-3-phosphate 3-phosphatidyltransferase
MLNLYTETVPSIHSLKPKFQRLLRPAVRTLAASGFTANHVTLFACALSVATGTMLTIHRRFLLVLPAVLFLRMALNAIDGMLAREFGQKSDLGACLNELCDVVSDSFLYLPFAWIPGLDAVWIGVVIVLAAISEMAGVVVVMIGSSRRYDGPMGKSDRAFVFGAIALWIAVMGDLPDWVAWLLPRLIALLLAATIGNRVRKGLAEPRSSRNPGARP